MRVFCMREEWRRRWSRGGWICFSWPVPVLSMIFLTWPADGEAVTALSLPLLASTAQELSKQHRQRARENTSNRNETDTTAGERGHLCASVEVAFKWSITQLTLVGIDEGKRGRTGRTRGEGARGWEGGRQRGRGHEAQRGKGQLPETRSGARPAWQHQHCVVQRMERREE